MRRLEVQEFVGEAPTPPVDGGEYLLDVLFRVGPIKGDMSITEGDLEPWERRRGIELTPWQAELLVDLSQAYMHESHLARDWSALCPWPKGRNIWKYVMDEKHKRQQAEENLKEQPRDGSSKRRRNPSPG